MLGVNADRVDPAWDASERVLIQGIIDAWFYEDEDIILVDYKTDRVDEEKDPEGKALVDHYRVQLELYAQALTQLTGHPVHEKLIYSVTLGREIPVV